MASSKSRNNRSSSIRVLWRRRKGCDEERYYNLQKKRDHAWRRRGCQVIMQAAIRLSPSRVGFVCGTASSVAGFCLKSFRLPLLCPSLILVCKMSPASPRWRRRRQEELTKIRRTFASSFVLTIVDTQWRSSRALRLGGICRKSPRMSCIRGRPPHYYRGATCLRGQPPAMHTTVRYQRPSLRDPPSKVTPTKVV